MSRTMNTHEHFGEALREARNYRGLTQAELAQRCESNDGGSTISAIENGRTYNGGKTPRRSGVGIAWVARLANGLDVTFYVTSDGRWEWLPAETTEK